MGNLCLDSSTSGGKWQLAALNAPLEIFFATKKTCCIREAGKIKLFPQYWFSLCRTEVLKENLRTCKYLPWGGGRSVSTPMIVLVLRERGILPNLLGFVLTLWGAGSPWTPPHTSEMLLVIIATKTRPFLHLFLPFFLTGNQNGSQSWHEAFLRCRETCSGAHGSPKGPATSLPPNMSGETPVSTSTSTITGVLL